MSELVSQCKRPLAMRQLVVAILCIFVFSFLLPVLCVGEKAGDKTLDLSQLSLEELLGIEVTIASKKPQSILNTTSATYVLTGEDIKRSGAMNLPDALRLVPGLNVASVTGNTWAVSSRGFSHVFANKLLVLIDGRTVYSPFHSGVYWDAQDVVMEDIDRIEIVRGPGATVWGENAVNGVINVITKPAIDTQGTMLTETVGTMMRDMRRGGTFGKTGHYRVYGKFLDSATLTDQFEHPGPNYGRAGSIGNSDRSLSHGGFRADWVTSANDQMTIQGDVYDGDNRSSIIEYALAPPLAQLTDIDTDISGSNVLGRWTRVCSDKSDFSLQMYVDQAKRNDPTLRDSVKTYDIDFQQHLALGKSHDLIWGAGYRLISRHAQDTFAMSFTHPISKMGLFSTFVQDDITLVPGKTRLTLGSKFEHNYFAGAVIQPTIRFLWTPNSRRSGWAAISRAVRTPSIYEEESRINTRTTQRPGYVQLVTIFGNPNVKAEELVAYELGYRAQVSPRHSYDIAAFYNVYSDLVTGNRGDGFPEGDPAYYVVPYNINNSASGQSYGYEIASNWRPSDWWQMAMGFTYLHFELRVNPGIDKKLVSSTYAEGQDPQNQFFLRSSMDLAKKVQLDTVFRYVDCLRGVNVPSYFDMDLRLAWQARENLEASIVAQNLLADHTVEYGTDSTIGTPASEVIRGIYGKLSWTF